MPAISCQKLTCGYNGKAVIEEIDLELEPGQIIALLGPNGSGKTTLLRTITGEIPVISGSLAISGQASTELSARDRAKQVAFVPAEERSEFPFLGREIVAMGRFPHSEGLFDSEDDKRITAEAMELAECSELADRSIMNVSAGEKQRILIARALAQKAPILLLDEPTSHLDPGHQVSVVKLARRLAESGLAILTALHDLNLAAHMADAAMLLKDSRVILSGSIAEVLDSPKIDEAYGTPFERLKGSDGTARLSPRYS